MGFNLDNTGDTGSTGASFKDTLFEIVDVADSTIKIKFDAAGSVGTRSLLRFTQTVNRTIDFPDLTGNVMMTIPVFTSGSIPFKNTTAEFAQDNANFFWDITNKRLGIGTNLPASKLHLIDAADTSGNGVAFITLENNHGTASDTFGLNFINTGYVGSARILSILDAGGASANLQFQTGGAAPSNILFLSSSGFSGFQTQSPTATLDVNGSSRLRSLIAGAVKSDASGNLSTGAISLTTEVTGVLPIANGGTNSSTALNNNRVVITSGGKIVEQSALTASRVMKTDGSGLPTTGTVDLTNSNEVSGLTTKGDLLSFSTVPARLGVGSNGQVLMADSTATTGNKWANLPSPTQQIFTSGSGTYTTPTGCRFIRVRMVGGGGGGGCSGTSSGGASSSGTASTFGTSLLTASPGVGAGNVSGAGTGGGGGGYTIAGPAYGIGINGATGGGGSYNVSAGILIQSGSGGGTGLAPGPGGTYNANGNAGITNCGTGGAGGGGGATALLYSGGGGGGAGFIDAWISGPSATYSYAIGSGGAGGTAGGSGYAGGAGADGQIIVDEYY